MQARCYITELYSVYGTQVFSSQEPRVVSQLHEAQKLRIRKKLVLSSKRGLLVCLLALATVRKHCAQPEFYNDAADKSLCTAVMEGAFRAARRLKLPKK